MKTAKKKTCEKRRAHTKRRMSGRAGIPDPGRLGSIFFGLAGAALGVPSAAPAPAPENPRRSAISARRDFSAECINAASFLAALGGGAGAGAAAGTAARGAARGAT